MAGFTPEELLERSLRLIRQQREIYGDFPVDMDAFTSEKPEAEHKEKHSEPMFTEDAPTEYKAQAEIQDSPLTEAELIQNCTTLDELRELCHNAEVLKTDLPNTNLVFGVGNPNADLMIVGEAPGENEDKQGEPFVGKAGQLLDKIMEAINFRRSDIYIANILKHRPPNNRDPKPEERQRSLPYLLRQIELVDPKLILCVGRISATTLLNQDSSLGKMRKKFHSFHGRELMATYHPAALLRNPQWKRPTWEDVQLLRARYDELGGQP